jgi:predicted NUDIX family NTP pyrophosphohydrolase
VVAKGEYGPGEDPLAAARREFLEETGQQPPGPFLPLAQRKQPSGKRVDAWATEFDLDTSKLVSNTFSLEWPKGSGRMRDFPEVDRAEWFDFPEASRRILPGQRGFLDELHVTLAGTSM